MYAFGFNTEDVHLLAGPSYHSAPGVFSGLQQLLRRRRRGHASLRPRAALRLIAEHRVTTTFMAPILVKRIVDVPA